MFSQSYEPVGPAGASWAVGVRGGKSYTAPSCVLGQMSDLAAALASFAVQGCAEEQAGKKVGQAGAKATANAAPTYPLSCSAHRFSLVPKHALSPLLKVPRSAAAAALWLC